MKTYQNYFCFLFVSLVLFSFKPGSANGQAVDSIDNGYYVSYPNQWMGSVYLSRKFAPFTISSSNGNDELKYRTNSTLDLGAGVSYRSLSLNLSYGFKFLNKEKGKGKTTGLDLQFHLYPHKWAIDLLASFRKGYYLDPEDNSALQLSNYYLRPDVKRNIAGLSLYRVPNSGRFSYRAALIQNDRQVKSAGSLLYGGQAYFGSMRGDSALVPGKVAGTYSQAGINRVNFINIGPGVGYAYTFVIAKYFFITGSAIANLDVSFATEESGSVKIKATDITPDFVYKGSIGYNSDSWSLSANIIGNAIFAASKTSTKEYFLPTGNMRLVLARKIGSGR